MPAPVALRLGDVPAYIEKTYNIKVTRQTVNNWARHGVRGTKLTTYGPRGRRRTTEGSVHEFLSKLG
jgi:hypothetical protein